MPIPEVSYSARPVNPERLSAIRKYAGRSILDVGCGNGGYVLALKDEYEISGVDLRSDEAWAAAPQLFSVSPADALAMADNSVDTVLCFELLEHLPDPLKALKEYRRVCRKNILVTAPNCDISPGMRQSHLLYFHWADRTHAHFFDMPSIQALLRKAGFRVSDSGFINRISLSPFFLEACGLQLNGFFLKAFSKTFSIFKRRHYAMTCLVVGEK